MPSIDCLDEIEIMAPPSLVYSVVSDYPNWHRWLPIYRCELVVGTRIEPGAQVHHRYGHPPIILSDFVRRIDATSVDEYLRESYIEGDLDGTGEWRFQHTEQGTLVSYHCKVSATSWFGRLSFRLLGGSAHSRVYQGLLAKLKQHCEALAVAPSA